MLVIFDSAERTLDDVKKSYKSKIICPSSFNELEKNLFDLNSPLITEFNSILPCNLEDLLGLIKKSKTPTAIYTNTNLYKENLDFIKESGVKYIIEKPLKFVKTWEIIINNLSENLETKNLIIIEKRCEPDKGYSPRASRNEAFEKGTSYTKTAYLVGRGKFSRLSS